MDESDMEKYEELGLGEKLHGTPVSGLKPAGSLSPRDLFLVTKRDVLSSSSGLAAVLDESQDGGALLEEGGFLANEDAEREL